MLKIEFRVWIASSFYDWLYFQPDYRCLILISYIYSLTCPYSWSGICLSHIHLFHTYSKTFFFLFRRNNPYLLPPPPPKKRKKRYSETMSPHTLSQSQGTFFKDHFHPIHTGVGPLCHPNTPSSDCIIPLERLGCVFFVCA